VERKVGWMTPLVSGLQHFCERHEEGAGAGAAAGLLAHLRNDWAEVPVVNLPAVTGDVRDPEELALVIVRDVGEVAAVLLDASDSDETLGWARANLIVDLERYVAAVGSPP
jgi:hypothetical protein